MKTYKLYDVPRGSKIRVVETDIVTPVGNKPPKTGEVLDFEQLDGMYSYCHDKDGNVVHLAAWTEVEVLQKDPPTGQNAADEGEGGTTE